MKKLVISLLCLFVNRKNSIAVCYCYILFSKCVSLLDGWSCYLFFLSQSNEWIFKRFQCSDRLTKRHFSITCWTEKNTISDWIKQHWHHRIFNLKEIWWCRASKPFFYTHSIYVYLERNDLHYDLDSIFFHVSNYA